MNRTKYLSVVFLALIAAFCLVQNATAQADEKLRTESNYNVRLQAVIGSNEADGRGNLPSELSNISKQFKSDYSFANYRLVDTFIGRIANNGNFEYKSVSNLLGTAGIGESATFLEWSIVGLRAGQNGLQIQAFRFSARIPVTTGSSKDENGRAIKSVNYEQIGVSAARMGVAENLPTLVGTLTLPKGNGTLFLVMTVSSADH